jgi:hypothetical protein
MSVLVVGCIPSLVDTILHSGARVKNGRRTAAEKRRNPGSLTSQPEGPRQVAPRPIAPRCRPSLGPTSHRSCINPIADPALARYDLEPAIPHTRRAKKGVRIGDSPGPDSQESTASGERSQARCASSSQGSVLLTDLVQRETHPGRGGSKVPSAELESAAFWSATSILCGYLQRPT